MSAERIAGRLCAAIARETPAGLGAWEPAWEIVEAPSAAFLEELALVEAGAGDRDRLVERGVEVLEAWKRAAAEWRAEPERAA